MLESKRLQLHSLASSACYRIHSDLRIAIAFELPDLMTLRGLYDARCPVLEIGRKPSFKGVRRLYDVIINRDDRVLDLTRQRIGQKEAAIQVGGQCGCRSHP